MVGVVKINVCQSYIYKSMVNKFIPKHLSRLGFIKRRHNSTYMYDSSSENQHSELLSLCKVEFSGTIEPYKAHLMRCDWFSSLDSC